jgi:hypothetical protein
MAFDRLPITQIHINKKKPFLHKLRKYTVETIPKMSNMLAYFCVNGPIMSLSRIDPKEEYEKWKNTHFPTGEKSDEIFELIYDEQTATYILYQLCTQQPTYFTNYVPSNLHTLPIMYPATYILYQLCTQQPTYFTHYVPSNPCSF